MANQLAIFTPNLAELSQPSCECLCTKSVWSWGTSQFIAIKQKIVKPTILAICYPTSETKTSADASSHDLGAVILQLSSTNKWRPEAYAS